MLEEGLAEAGQDSSAYNKQPFQPDGRMGLDIAFGDKTMCTPVYFRMDAHDQLL